MKGIKKFSVFLRRSFSLWDLILAQQTSRRSMRTRASSAAPANRSASEAAEAARGNPEKRDDWSENRKGRVMPLRKVTDCRKVDTMKAELPRSIQDRRLDRKAPRQYHGPYGKKEPRADIQPGLYASQQEFLNVLKWAKKQDEGKQTDQVSKMVAADTESIVNAARQRLKFWDISDAQIAKIEKTGKPVRTLTLYSPVSGYVIQKSAIQGMKVMPGEKLFDVADLSSLWITAEIYQYELPLIKPASRPG